MQLRDAVTENDGSLCPVRIVCWALAFQFIAGSAWATYHKKEFAPADYGQGAALLLAAIGGAIGYNKKHEYPTAS